MPRVHTTPHVPRMRPRGRDLRGTHRAGGAESFTARRHRSRASSLRRQDNSGGTASSGDYKADHEVPGDAGVAPQHRRHRSRTLGTDEEDAGSYGSGASARRGERRVDSSGGDSSGSGHRHHHKHKRRHKHKHKHKRDREHRRSSRGREHSRGHSRSGGHRQGSRGKGSRVKAASDWYPDVNP